MEESVSVKHHPAAPTVVYPRKTYSGTSENQLDAGDSWSFYRWWWSSGVALRRQSHISANVLLVVVNKALWDTMVWHSVPSGAMPMFVVKYPVYVGAGVGPVAIASSLYM